jgi:hypothetical protein
MILSDYAAASSGLHLTEMLSCCANDNHDYNDDDDDDDDSDNSEGSQDVFDNSKDDHHDDGMIMTGKKFAI